MAYLTWPLENNASCKTQIDRFFGIVISQWPSIDKSLIKFSLFADTTEWEEKKKQVRL